ncbi:transposase [Pseudomonas tritici]
MARRPRLLVPGLSLHIIQRGNNRSVCFYSEDDYIFYIHLLKLLSETHGCKIHAWCLMTENRGQTTITAKTYIGGLTPIFSSVFSMKPLFTTIWTMVKTQFRFPARFIASNRGGVFGIPSIQVSRSSND